MPKSVTLTWVEYQRLLESAEKVKSTPAGHQYTVQLEAAVTKAQDETLEEQQKVADLQRYISELEADHKELSDDYDALQKRVQKLQKAEDKFHLEKARRIAAEKERDKALAGTKIVPSIPPPWQRPHPMWGGGIQVAPPGEYQTWNARVDDGADDPRD